MRGSFQLQTSVFINFCGGMVWTVELTVECVGGTSCKEEQ